MPVTLPDELLAEARLSEPEAKLEIACRLYDAGKLTVPQATRWAGISRVAFENALLERNLPLVCIDDQYLAQETDMLQQTEAE